MRSQVSQRRLACSLALLALFLPASAARSETVTATQVAERTNKVLEAFDWTNDLDLLKEKARKEKKLVFWLQIVGDLNGGL